ncbi:MAG TPA: BadF/BadG/BcrA/BcrD ATPase family protein [Ignavibacteria bacterium]
MFLGIDIGSTSIKIVLLDDNDSILWKKYIRHETKQIEKLLEILQEVELNYDLFSSKTFVFVTGSGGGDIANIIGGKYIQEVNCISTYVEKKYQDVNSVIELGGQDAKMIFFLRDKKNGNIKKITTMNDKCAGGTGVIIDKIASKLKIDQNTVSKLPYKNIKLHNIAGKCGVFAETDINGLQKLGIPSTELMASLFESIVQQNLSVLTRGNTLRPKVFLLGGPNTFIKGMVEAWQENILKLWSERNIYLNKSINISDLIIVPENSEFFAALGSIYYGKNFENYSNFIYKGSKYLLSFIENDLINIKTKEYKENSTPLYKGVKEFLSEYSIPEFIPQEFEYNQEIEAYLGIDGGSTTTKAVLLDKNTNLLRKYYQLSLGNPIDDIKTIISRLYDEIHEKDVKLKILGVGVTGYAKNIIKNTIKADVAIVETIAHAQAALHYYDKVDVICDVGGQDIKIMMLRDNAIIDFKLNTQCSAGNGYFLQTTAESFGIDINDYSRRAFSVKRYPNFGYGCSVFLQSDIVNFQRKGWSPDEILAGLACVLPKNIWYYVSQIPNLTRLGNNFILQGGTQYNKAAAKAQIDFIQDKFREHGLRANIKIHKYAGECGAIGAALEARKVHLKGRESMFIGLKQVKNINYKSVRDETTRCHFCKNNCLRTFIDIHSNYINESNSLYDSINNNKYSSFFNEDLNNTIYNFHTRIIIANCEKGAVEKVEDVKEINKNLIEVKLNNPNLIEYASKNIWNIPKIESVYDLLINKNKKSKDYREKLVFGIPRVLNLYQYAPFFIGYLLALGINRNNLIFSDYTDEKLYREGSKRGSIDPCYPTKVAISHIHNLIFNKNKIKKINYILFPIVDTILSNIVNTVGHKSCPASIATPEVVKAAFTKEEDLFLKHNILYLNPFINLDDFEKSNIQLFSYFKKIFNLSYEENQYAVQVGYNLLKNYDKDLKFKGRELLKKIEKEKRIGIVFLSRPYHNDPGLNHGIPEEFQKLGYPIFSIDSLPTDSDLLEDLFRDDIKQGIINHPLDISDVWKNSFSENTNKKIWAAKFVSRHPNLVAIELSNFKCGHDSTTYSVVRDIIYAAGGAFFSFRDIDENKPTSSIKIRIETIDYFLKNYYLSDIKIKEKRLLNQVII